METAGSVVAVTGGSRGFGLAIAKALVEHGARVGLVARDAAQLAQAASELGGAEKAFAVAADVSDRAAVHRALAQVKERFGRFDALINNAGLARPGRVEELVESEVIAQVHTNFLGTVFACQAAIPLLRGAPDPRIINISSASAKHYDEMSHLSIYAAGKAAVERFTRELRRELQQDAIGVSCIRPGAAWTGFSDDWDAAARSAGIEAWRRDAGPGMDAGMQVEQVAEAVLYVLQQPPGVAVDLLEVRPNRRVPKLDP